MFESYIDRFAYRQNKMNSIQIAGWCFGQSFGVDYTLEINGKRVDFILKETSRQELFTQFPSGITGNGKGFFISYTANDSIHDVKLWAHSSNESSCICSYNERRLKQIKNTSPYDFNIDTYEIKKDKIVLTGWASQVKNIQMKGKYSIERFPRRDLVVLNIIDEKDAFCGFKIECEKEKKPVLVLDETEIPLKKDWVTKNEDLIVSSFTRRNMDRALHVLLDKGLKKIVDRVLHKNATNKSLYHAYALSHDVTDVELEKQREMKFSYNPKMSLVVATFNTPIEYLKKMVDTVMNQSYSNWELCIADGSKDASVLDYIKENYKDNRIKTIKLDKNYGISGNMNAAIEIATGEYIGLYDHDDELTLDALYEFVKAINENKELKVIYSDEDKINSDGTYRFEPSFKPDFNIDFLRSYNYICHLLFVKKSHMDQVGYLLKEYDGAQDHDFVLRCTENLKANEIHHIQRVLYHWRIHQNSTAGNAQSKLYAFESGIKAVSDHYKRMGIEASVDHGSSLGCYVSKYKVKGNPLVSILIQDATQECLDSISKSTYTNYEIVSSNPKGEYVILLDGHTKVITEDWIEELLGRCQREDVGAIGARLYYLDETIAHAGIIVGGENGYLKAFEHFPKGSSGYASRLFSCMDVSAVCYCVMTKASLLQPLNSSYSFETNCIAYCLHLRQLGYNVVYNPYCELYYFGKEEKNNVEEWKTYRDPYYNDNLTLNQSDFSLKE